MHEVSLNLKECVLYMWLWSHKEHLSDDLSGTWKWVGKEWVKLGIVRKLIQPVRLSLVQVQFFRWVVWLQHIKIQKTWGNTNLTQVTEEGIVEKEKSLSLPSFTTSIFPFAEISSFWNLIALYKLSKMLYWHYLN
jgi:hypothetical protein